MYRRWIKPALDFVFALVGLVTLCPLLLLLSLVLWIVNGPHGVLFVQPRIGRDGRIFRMFKFKTMNDRRDRNGNLLPDLKRMTVLGRFLRASSLDEIPQLINILLGQMSFVGPRPLLVEFRELYTPEQMRRHEVCGGITGWAQVHGRNSVTWNERLEYDVWYVDHVSFLLDLKILIMTVSIVFRMSDINTSSGETRIIYERDRSDRAAR